MKVTAQKPPPKVPLRFVDLAVGEPFRCDVAPEHACMKVSRWAPDGYRYYRVTLNTGELAETNPDVAVTRLDAEVVVRGPTIP